MKERATFSDDQVIQSVVEGRTQNFEIIVNRYHKKIVNFIYRMIFDYDEAQNIAQDVFLKIFETLDRYRPEQNFQAFIFTIARNLTLNYIKQRKRTLFFSHLFSGSGEERHLGYEAPQEKILEGDVRERLLTDALKGLKEDQRLALILKVYLELSYKQIADITNWSEPKIETLISRAKTALKNKIFLQENRGPDVLTIDKRNQDHENEV
jgi:RNA polymerase sigma-70 factor (ECF subfamily)